MDSQDGWESDISLLGRPVNLSGHNRRASCKTPREKGNMRKTILMMLLAVVSGSAAAEWEEVANNENATTYADFVTIRKEGNLAKMWDVIDYKRSIVLP